jgi:DNA polymerase III sliding clamp (beta) subunit (PCNA family)
MFIDKNYKLEYAAEKKSATRDNLKNINFQKDYAVASNGHIMAFVPVESDSEDTTGLLNAENLKLARKNSVSNGNVFMRVNGSFELMDKTKLPKENIAFPDYLSVIPENNREYTIALNAKLLYQLSQAMGCEKVVLEFISPNKAIKVYDLDNKESFGLLMPVRSDGEIETTTSKIIDSELKYRNYVLPEVKALHRIGERQRKKYLTHKPIFGGAR